MTKFNIGDKVKFRKWTEATYEHEGTIREIEYDGSIALYHIEYFEDGELDCEILPGSRVAYSTEEIHISVIDKNNDQVNHPAHYNVQGRKECIEEMIEKYGPLAVYNFCMCNAYKYSYRAGYKDDKEQDLKKAEWYIKKGVELLPLAQQENGDVPRAEIQKIADYCSFEDQIEKLKEEVGELRCAIDNFQADDKADNMAHVWEEAADVAILLQQLLYLADETDCNMFKAMMEFKVNRQLARIEEEKRYWNDPF